MKGIYAALSVLLLSFGLKAQTFSWSGLMRIYDLQTDTVHVPVSGLPTTIDTTFGIAHVCFDITHTYIADLSIRIVSPAGTSVNLVQSKGGSGDNYMGTCVGMDGTAFSNSSAPYSGIFVPVGNLASINNGQNPNGDWLFIVTDNANADTGSIHNVSIEFTNNPPNSTNTGTPITPTATYVWPGVVCPGGAGSCDLLPDMTASAKEIQLNHNETPGFLYISNATPNIGYGPMEIYGIDSCYCGNTLVPCGTICPNGEEIQHVVRQRIYQKQPGTDTLTYYDRTAGRMTYHPTHGHLHVDNWSNYTLRTATANPDATTWPIVGVGTKQSFCLINLGTCSGNNGQCKDNLGNTVTTVPNQNLGFNTGCGLTQGIYPGNYDVYSISLNDPIVLTNVCNGNYYIVSITDPDNNFLESDETNNWVAVPITLTQQNPAPLISASGPNTLCQGDSVILTSSVASNYLWSTGDTTQSIVVKTAGTYTVSTNCGTSVTSSLPFNISATQVSINAAASEISVCSGTTVQLSSSASSNAIATGQTTFISNQQVFIPDNNTTGITSPIVVSGVNPGTLSSNSVISVKLNLTHTYDGDLKISLIAPSGNTIILSNRRGGGGDNFINTIFTMSASTLISAGTAPFTGNFKPDESFALLTGNANGTWLLKVQDLAGVDTGRVQNWSISLSNTVAETFSYSWSSLPSGFSSVQQNTIANPTTSTVYQVEATSDMTGCKNSMSVPVSVLNVSSFMPSSGSPGTVITVNGEGFSGVTGVTIGGDACAFTIVNDNLLNINAPSNGGGVICVSTAGCTVCTQSAFTVQLNSTMNLNVKVFIQGFYLGNGLMEASVDPSNQPSLCDTVIVELHDPNNPSVVSYSNKGTLNISGSGTFEFPSAAAGNSYYIVVRHRNAVETWSANPVIMFNNLTYDFTNAISKAYGSNQFPLGDGYFAMYSGDITDVSSNLLGSQDGVIESQDYLEEENAVNLILSGYIPQDVTGDGIAEAYDYIIVQNNVTLLIFSIHP